jgi:hypothetical protein
VHGSRLPQREDWKAGVSAATKMRLRSSTVRVVEVHRETNREFLSPYFRRVAVTLNILELPFELQELTVFKEPDVGR